MFIEEFMYNDQMMGEEGYCFVTFNMALSYITQLDVTQINDNALEILTKYSTEKIDAD